MESLEQREWTAFPIMKLFDRLEPGKGKGLNHLPKSSTGINYVGATNRNNGVLCSVEENDISRQLIQKGNCVGFIKNGDGSAGYAIYKREDFVSTSDVIYAYAGWLNLNAGLFFVASQDKIEAKYSHGYKRNQQHLRGDKVMLPVTESGEPNFAYMEQYVQERRAAMLEKYKAYVERSIAEIGPHVDIPALSDKEWGKFRAFGNDCLFNIKATSSSIDGIRLMDGSDMKVPYITRTDTNNGISRYVSSKNFSYGYDRGGCITVGLDTQTAFWQPYNFVTGQNIQVVTGEALNKAVALFIIPLLKNQMRAKFNWGGNGATLGRMKVLEILLPITDSGEPDFAYMEQYAKNMMLRKYRQYLAFLEKKTVT